TLIDNTSFLHVRRACQPSCASRPTHRQLPDRHEAPAMAILPARQLLKKGCAGAPSWSPPSGSLEQSGVVVVLELDSPILPRGLEEVTSALDPVFTPRSVSDEYAFFASRVTEPPAGTPSHDDEFPGGSLFRRGTPCRCLHRCRRSGRG